jgi:transcriptional regulator with XRE-family HTH domain
MNCQTKKKIMEEQNKKEKAMYKHIVALNLKKCREALSLSVMELSNKTDIPVAHLERIEAAESDSFNIANLVTLTEFFRVSLDSFVQNAFLIPNGEQKPLKTY